MKDINLWSRKTDKKILLVIIIFIVLISLNLPAKIHLVEKIARCQGLLGDACGNEVLNAKFEKRPIKIKYCSPTNLKEYNVMIKHECLPGFQEQIINY